jgi:hypothetical protein
MTRMSGANLAGRELKEPEAYSEFDPMNPANSAPTVAWLASDEALHVTGQVFRAVASTITHYRGWTLGAAVETDGRWDATRIGAAVNGDIFGSRATGLKMPGRR